jgi:hypothetical protein
MSGLGLVALVLAAPAQAAGDLLVAPTRVVLDGARGTEVILNNIDSVPATYRVSLEVRRMNADGTLDEVEPEKATAAEAQALSMITYAPRRVELAPNQPQAIRIGVRSPADLDAEVRGARESTAGRGAGVGLQRLHGAGGDLDGAHGQLPPSAPAPPCPPAPAPVELPP